jgi:hypothetical protein
MKAIRLARKKLKTLGQSIQHFRSIHIDGSQCFRIGRTLKGMRKSST